MKSKADRPHVILEPWAAAATRYRGDRERLAVIHLALWGADAALCSYKLANCVEEDWNEALGCPRCLQRADRLGYQLPSEV